MRAGAGARAVAALVGAAVVAGCSGGDGTGGGAAATSSTAAPDTSTTAPATTVPPVTSTTTVADPEGSVTLRIAAFTLPDLRTGGTGLRVLVRASSSSLRVRRRGAGGAVAVCPVASASAPVAVADCTELGADATVEVRLTGGVELRATGADARVEEVGLTYLPVDRSMTLVTPARPAGSCSTARPCETSYSLLPARPGEFRLDGRAGGGRSRLALVSTPLSGGGRSRTLATVEGGGSLSIRGTLEAGAQGYLFHHEEAAEAVAPLTAEIFWP